MAVSEIEGVKLAGANTTLWRYMSLSKLLQMLQSRQVWFSRVDQLVEADPYEGSLPFTVLPDEVNVDREAEIEKNKQLKFGSISKSRTLFFENFKRQREFTYVSCWHSGSTDNDAMWRLYGAERDGSVCVKTTVSQLSRQLPPFINVGRVEYVSYDDPWLENPSAYVPFFRKRTCFQHENEVRFLFNSVVDDMGPERPSREKDRGWPISFQPSDALNAIYVAPTSPPWFKSVVSQAVLELNLDIAVEEAPMARRPMF